MDIDYNALDLGWKIFLTAMNAALFIYSIVSNKQKANASSIKAVEHKVDEETEQLGNRITRIEAKLEDLPGHDDLASLHDRVNATAKQVDNIDGRLEGITNILHLIHQSMLNGGNKQ